MENNYLITGHQIGANNYCQVGRIESRQTKEVLVQQADDVKFGD
jgi:hypothetical protein